MRITKDRLRQIIKEEVSGMLDSPKTADQFLNTIKSQFRLASTRGTLDSMAKYYDAMIRAAAERAPLSPSDPKEIATEIGIDQSSPYMSWVTFHLNKLQRVPKEAYSTLPASDELTAMHYDRLAAKEKRKSDVATKLAKPLSPEEKKAREIEFGRRMSRGDYGRLD
jgi:hypothetical protein